jgi:hypothetical protein
MHKITPWRPVPTRTLIAAGRRQWFSAWSPVQSSWPPVRQVLALFRKSRDLGVHIFRMQRHHILGVFGLHKALRKFERGCDVSLREPYRQFANFLGAGLHAGRLIFSRCHGMGCINVICACGLLAFRAPWTSYCGSPMRALSAEVSHRDDDRSRHATGLSSRSAFGGTRVRRRLGCGAKTQGKFCGPIRRAGRFSELSRRACLRRSASIPTIPRRHRSNACQEHCRAQRRRGWSACTGAVLVCLCSRVMLADNSAAILIIHLDGACWRQPRLA